MDNTGNDLRHEINFESCKKKKKQIFYSVKHFLSFVNKGKCFLILGKVVFIIPQNSIALALFFPEADTKKHRYASALLSVKANSERC